MDHPTFTKDQIAHTLGIQPYMLAAWGKQFEVTPLMENETEAYTSEHLETFKTIKALLYDKGMTLAAAKKALQDKTSALDETAHAAVSSLFFEPAKKSPPINSSDTIEPHHSHVTAAQLLHIKSQLQKIRTTL